ncbi:DUF1289 domain-containing protein [Roseibacterium beibuensis]|uniref:DUF1289 domain-containing protein n=1 Tax=[Roseibacterium] beibuensis TaxID=1193142 RepID=A0ABP9L121_9RHOB|nr:DUF1289 domain-containing protein [Roseibacterium beibuensis]MCS6621475.1 DUF1289 domain-containing protein [Roseibacterium beibuensis]
MTLEARRPPTTPCLGVCVFDAAVGRCIGCARTLDEIAEWGRASDAYRESVWAELPGRAAEMGLTVRRLDWQGERLLDEVAARFAAAEGRFAVGVHGAVAEVLRAPDEPFETDRAASVLTVKTPRAALRVKAATYLTAFEIQRPEDAPVIALAVPKGRAGQRGPAELTDLGPDAESLLARDAGGRRFDLGLGRRVARFTLRCSAELSDAIAPQCGTPWPDCLERIGPAVLSASPVRVVEAPCLRAEVDTPMSPPGTTPPEGPHTGLLPAQIAQGRSMPPNLSLPDDYVLSALFYPS